ncbi:hypothetical protein JCM19239_3954 [Vibrio variabilis]|uniref:Uncharacterized protein n=1 Tax=Vibrio variabilis TaxID=990271 RepID=A0ABQ0J681_9VIBR|nr:hypothetical protein JCM19239_3954 [Vibrio variabilis]
MFVKKLLKPIRVKLESYVFSESDSVKIDSNIIDKLNDYYLEDWKEAQKLIVELKKK